MNNFVKLIAIKVDVFSSYIIDEINIDEDDTLSIMNFKKKYNKKEHICLIIHI